MYELTKHEELVLLSILKLKENAYGVTIRKNIKSITGKSINYGSLYNTLYLLVRRELINSMESEPKSEQGGRRKVMYSLTAEGKKALRNAYEVHRSAWNGLAEYILEGD